MGRKNNRLNIRVSESFLQKLEDLCKENDRSKTAQIEELVKNEWGKKHKK